MKYETKNLNKGNQGNPNQRPITTNQPGQYQQQQPKQQPGQPFKGGQVGGQHQLPKNKNQGKDRI